MNEPRPLFPSSIRRGDHVRASTSFYVADIRDNAIVSTDGEMYARGDFGWTLLERPHEPGTRWEDPETGARYVRTDSAVKFDPQYLRYAGCGRSDFSGHDSVGIIARLIPLDGAS